MIRALALAIIAAFPLMAAAQQGDTDAVICVSLSAPDGTTEVAIFGADDTALVLVVPPPGAQERVQNRLVTLPPDAFPAMQAALRDGLPALPEVPGAEACDPDAPGPVVLALSDPGQGTLRYDAPCLSDAVLTLNDALIAATGDPSGEAARAWTSPNLRVMHDICRTLP